MHGAMMCTHIVQPEVILDRHFASRFIISLSLSLSLFIPFPIIRSDWSGSYRHRSSNSSILVYLVVSIHAVVASMSRQTDVYYVRMYYNCRLWSRWWAMHACMHISHIVRTYVQVAVANASSPAGLQHFRVHLLPNSFSLSLHFSVPPCKPYEQ